MTVLVDQRGLPTKKPKGYKVAPQSKASLDQVGNDLVNYLRDCGCYSAGKYYLDVSKLLEDVLFRAGYNFHVADDIDLTETAAFTIPDQKIIVLRNSVYEGVYKGEPFSRFTVVHEFAHIVLQHHVTLHRGATLGEHKIYEDSEWQANFLAAAILMPQAAISELDQKPLLVASECGTSPTSANYRIQNMQ